TGAEWPPIGAAFHAVADPVCAGEKQIGPKEHGLNRPGKCHRRAAAMLQNWADGDPFLGRRNAAERSSSARWHPELAESLEDAVFYATISLPMPGAGPALAMWLGSRSSAPDCSEHARVDERHLGDARARRIIERELAPTGA